MRFDTIFSYIDILNIRRIAVAGFTFASLVLTGCAPGIPLLKQLESEKINRIAIIIEKPPFKYTVPVNGDAPLVGSVVPVLFGAFGALAVENNLNRDHLLLTQAAASADLTTDYRENFVAEVIKGFAEKGVTVEIIRAKFLPTTLGKNRSFYKPDLKEIKLPSEMPSLYLNLDMGSCTVGIITPCIYYLINSTGLVSAAQSNQRYTGVAGIVPNLYGINHNNLFHYKNIDLAVSQITEFDQALMKLIPVAAKQLVNTLEKGPEGRPK